MRGLDPERDLALLRTAFEWRNSRLTRRLCPVRMSFDQLIRANNQIAMGLFDGEDLIALYVVIEFESGRFDLHFTAKRLTPKHLLIAGGVQLTNWLLGNGAREVSALIVGRNRPLRIFLEACGYSLVGNMVFSDTLGRQIPYLKYAAI